MFFMSRKNTGKLNCGWGISLLDLLGKGQHADSPSKEKQWGHPLSGEGPKD